MRNRQRTGAMLITAVIGLALCAALPALAQRSVKKARAANGGAQVIATVNGEKITLAQVVDDILADQIARLNATNPAMVDKQRLAAGSIGALVLKRMKTENAKTVTISRAEIMDWMTKDKPPVLTQAVQNTIAERAISQAAKVQGITVTPAELKQKLGALMQNIRTQLRLDPKLTDAQVYVSVGIRPESLRRAFLPQVQIEKLLRKDLVKKLGHAIGSGDFAEASHILIKPVTDPQKPNENEKAFEAAKTRLSGYADEIKAGKTKFEQAAEQYSDDGSKLQQGKLGVFMRGQMVPEFEKVAFSLEKGKISDPVRTQYGWHLIRLDRPGTEITATEREQALQNYFRSRTQSYALELVQKAKVTNKLKPKPTGPVMMPGGGQ